MSTVTAQTMTPEHVKAARAFLKWNAQQLADECSVAVATVRIFESGRKVRESSCQAIYDALLNAGIEFQNDGNPGVRLVK